MLLLAALGAPGRVVAQHSALLPRPQLIRYGQGRLPLRGLIIAFRTRPSREDQFAAAELAAILSNRSGSHVEIAAAPPSMHAVVLLRTGAADDLAQPGEQPGPDSPEAYSIHITPAGAEVRARSSRGLFYAVQTLRQLVQGQGASASFPSARIQDWPSLAYRGVMVDMSHGALPTEAEVERQLDFLSRWKVNQYYFYSEDSIALNGYPLVDPGGQFTKHEVSRIIAYGRARHIDVIPCLELFGHQHDLFRIEKYSALAAFPHGDEFNSNSPAAEKLLADWAKQYMDLFPSPFVHIGFDEAWELAKAAARQGTSPAMLFTRQLDYVARLFQRRGKHVMMWADMIVQYPGILSQLPPGIIAVAWDYSPRPSYSYWLAPLVREKVPHFVATGIHSWFSIAPDFGTTFDNIDAFTEEARKSHALGLMNTVWADDAASLMRMSWPGMAYGAAESWQSAPIDRSSFFADYSRVVFSGTAAPEIASGLRDLDQAEGLLEKTVGDNTVWALWSDPFNPDMLRISENHRQDFRQMRVLAENAYTHFHRALHLGEKPARVDAFLFGSRMLDYAGFKFLNSREIADEWNALGSHPTHDQVWKILMDDIIYQAHGRLGDQMDDIGQLKGIYRTDWLAEYTPYRLPAALGRFQAEYELWRHLQWRLIAFGKTFKTGEMLPRLDKFVR